MKWFSRNSDARQAQTARQLASEWESRSKDQVARLSALSSELGELLEKLRLLSERTRLELSQAARTEAEYQSVVDGLRNEIKVAEATIQTQEYHNRLIQERIRRDIAVQTIRQVEASGREEQE